MTARATGAMLLRGLRRTRRAIEVAQDWSGHALRVLLVIALYLVVGSFLGVAGVHALYLLRGDNR